jgi:heme/copper-type cytochrome/quinol oxidase subunit 3
MSRAVESIDASGRRELDVSGLPDSAWDSRDPVWWGNTLLIFIETTTIMLLVVSYFYVRRNFNDWPPVQSNTPKAIYNPLPDLPIATVELILIVASCLPMYLIDMAARRENRRQVVIGLWFMLAVTIVAIVMRFYEFQHLKFRWDDNAYGSITWTILGTHLTYLLGAGAEFFIMALWLSRRPIDEKHALDVTLAGGYWYWVAGTWLLCYGVVYFGARLL